MNARKVLFIGLIALFGAMTLFVNFFHTEKGIRGSDTCPACRLQASSLAIHEVDGIVAPRLQMLEYVSALEYAGYEGLAAPAFATRGPPSV